jgi:hypothetical protein
VESVTSALFAEPHFTISSLLTVLRPRWRRFRKGPVGRALYSREGLGTTATRSPRLSTPKHKPSLCRSAPKHHEGCVSTRLLSRVQSDIAPARLCPNYGVVLPSWLTEAVHPLRPARALRLAMRVEPSAFQRMVAWTRKGRPSSRAKNSSRTACGSVVAWKTSSRWTPFHAS